MSRSILCAIVFAAVCLCVLPQQARAQYAYGVSAIGYDDTTKEVFGYSGTELDYYAGYYYDPYVEGFMYDQYNYYPIDSGYSRGFAYYWPAEVNTYRWGTLPNTEYDVISDHYVIAAWSTSVQVCDDYYFSGCWADYWYDAWGYGFLGGGDFGAPWWWWGSWYGGYVPARTYYLGSTGVYIITPSPQPTPTPTPTFTVGIINSNTGARLSANENALRGARVRLEAVVDPASEGGGTFNWTFSGPSTPQMMFGTTSSQSITFLMNQDGAYTATVNYTKNNVTRSASVNIQVVVPTLDSFTATQRAVRAGPSCDPDNQGGNDMSLGCPSPGQYGIEWTATIKAPETYISDPSDSKVKFTQYVNLFERRSHGGVTECSTLRAFEDDLSTGWTVDRDPYGRSFRVNATDFTESNFSNRPVSLVSINDRDTPRTAIDGNDTYYIDDRFELYVVYFTGPLLTPDLQQPIGVLEWNFGGEAQNNGGTWSLVRALSTPGPKTGRALPSTTPFPPRTILPDDPRLVPWGNCTGRSPNPTPTPTPTPTPLPTPVPTPPSGGSGNNAAFVSQSVPASMEAGQVYTVLVTMRNTGSTTWTNEANYRLGAQNPQDNWTWGINRVYLPSPVPPGAEVTFNFNVTAPSTPSFYNFQWRMVQDGVEWFGETTPNVVIDVFGAGCDPYAEQDCYYNGGDWWDSNSCTCHYVQPCRKCDIQPMPY
jgi:hypothetical protein